MRILDRYLLRELLLPFGYCLGGFFLFWNTFDLFGELGTFQKRHLTFIDVLEYYVFKTPEQLSVVLPVALLLGLLYTLTNHSRYNELVAIRAAGVSLVRLSLPYFVVGFICSLILFAINELWLPQSLEATEAVLNRRLTDAPDQAKRAWVRVEFNNQGENRQWVVKYNRLTHQMIAPHIVWTLPNGTKHDFTAEAGYYSKRGWVFTNVQEIVFPARAGFYPIVTNSNVRLMSELTETPKQIKSQIKITKMDDFRTASRTQLSIREIIEFLKWNKVNPEKRDMLKTKLHGRFAAPWTCVVIVLIALPFGTVSSRRNVYVGVASSIVICFAYFVLVQLGLAVGSGGYFPPIIAAWLPNLTFAGVGIFLTLQKR